MVSLRRKDTGPVAVLGCGPSGLLAAHAATCAGRQVRIFSNMKKSVIGGAQFLHRAIPSLTDDEPDGYIKHSVHGTGDGYQLKAYGGGAQPDFVSFSHVHDGLTSPAWNLREIYEALWRVYRNRINEATITPEWLGEFLGGEEFSLVVNTVPRLALCMRQPRHTDQVHNFRRQRIQIVNQCLPGTRDSNTIYYDGTGDTSWYRASYIFGVGSTEWGGHLKLPFPEHTIVPVFKPLGTNCDCWATEKHLMHAGRFGTWTKGVLTHHAFEGVLERLGVSEEEL